MGFSIGSILKPIASLIGGDTSDTKDYYKEQQKQVEQSSAANAAISRYDAKVALETALNARMAAEHERSLRWKQIEKVMGEQMTAFANRGVVSTEGTALDVQLETAGDMAVDAEIAYYNGRTAEEQAESLAKRYLMLAEAGLRDGAAQSVLLGSASDQAVDNQIWSRAMGNIQLVNTIGQMVGYW